MVSSRGVKHLHGISFVHHILDPLRVMVATGWNDYYMDDIEIVNIGGSLSNGTLTQPNTIFVFSGNSSCLNPPEYPHERVGAAGAFLDGKARICGGENNTGIGTTDCYEHEIGDDSWTLSGYALSEGRFNHVGVRCLHIFLLAL